MRKTGQKKTDHDREQCPNCDSTNVHEVMREQEFEYGTGDRAVRLKAKMPVFECVDCGFAFSDERSDKARTEAICRYENLLCPDHIVTIRENAGMSRSAFCKLGRFGQASLPRWENGQLVQNGANDQLIYLFQFPPVVQLLEARQAEETLLTQETVYERLFTAFQRYRLAIVQADRPRRRKTFRALRDHQKLEAVGNAWKLRRAESM